MKIIEDAGHGRYGNKGQHGYWEGERMWKLTQYEKEEWKNQYGIDIGLSRKSLTHDPKVYDRGLMAKGYNLLISNHSNAPGGNNTSVRGVEIYDSVDKTNKALAEKLGKAIAKVMGTPFRGVRYRKNSKGTNWYGVLRGASVVGCNSEMIIEHGYHTNSQDAKWLLNDNNLRKLAKIKVEIIAKHYGIVKKDYYGLDDKGPGVKKIQQDLLDIGYRFINGGKSYGADGFYGEATRKTVIKFQQDFNLQVDGYAGPETKSKLRELINKKNNKSDVIYKVQTGAFSKKENAKHQAEKLKKEGFDTYIEVEKK